MARDDTASYRRLTLRFEIKQIRNYNSCWTQTYKFAIIVSTIRILGYVLHGNLRNANAAW